MTDIDEALSRLKNLPGDPRLQRIEAVVLDAISQPGGAGLRESNAVLGIAAGLALSVGLVAAAIPDHQAEAASITPFGAPPALAPSSLLGGSK